MLRRSWQSADSRSHRFHLAQTASGTRNNPRSSATFHRVSTGAPRYGREEVVSAAALAQPTLLTLDLHPVARGKIANQYATAKAIQEPAWLNHLPSVHWNLSKFQSQRERRFGCEPWWFSEPMFRLSNSRLWGGWKKMHLLSGLSMNTSGETRLGCATKESRLCGETSGAIVLPVRGCIQLDAGQDSRPGGTGRQ